MICRICDNDELIPVLDLGLQPWANNFLRAGDLGRESKFPLKLVHCTRCSCVQLDYTVPKEVMFSDHTYVSGTTRTLSRHFAETAQRVKASLPRKTGVPTVLDIGSNDGTQLLQYKQLGFDALGIECCARVAGMAQKAGVETVVDYFNEATAAKLQRKFDVINASGVFFHLEELHSAARGVRMLLADDGVFVVQFLYMRSIVENLAFDQIYHEHLLYYTLQTLNTLLRRHGLEAFDAYLAPIHGGSIVCYATHAGRRPASPGLEDMLSAEERDHVNSLKHYQEFGKRVASMKQTTLRYLDSQKALGKTIYGLGAPVKGNTFLNYCGIGRGYLDCLVELNPLRKGLYSPGMHIPVVMEQDLSGPPDVYFVLAWNFREEILERYKSLIEDGVEFYFPVNCPARESGACRVDAPETLV